jgi:hypothetical protein
MNGTSDENFDNGHFIPAMLSFGTVKVTNVLLINIKNIFKFKKHQNVASKVSKVLMYFWKRKMTL